MNYLEPNVHKEHKSKPLTGYMTKNDIPRVLTTYFSQLVVQTSMLIFERNLMVSFSQNFKGDRWAGRFFWFPTKA